MSLKRLLVALALAVLAAAARPLPAQAGPVEELVQLALHPSDPDVMVVRYEYSGEGLLYSNDGGSTFELVCASSIKLPDGPPVSRLGPIAIGGDGKVMVGVFGGMWVDDAEGCGWGRETSLEGKWITDIVAHPTDPEISFAISSNGGEQNGVIRRNADGSFTELGEKKELLLNRVRVATLGESVRIYESAVGEQIMKETDAGVIFTPSFMLRMSDDEGETWIEQVIGEVDGQLRLEAVDPTNPDRIVLSIARDRLEGSNVPLPDSIIVTEDLGETLTEWTTVTAFGGIAFGEGGEVWIADRGDTMGDVPKGIWHAPSLGGELEQLTDAYPVTCLHYRGGELLACQRFAFGRVDLESGEFAASLRFPMLETMNQCEGVDMAAACRQQMCSGYCGTGHFATAPMCVDVYDSNEERGCAPPAAPVVDSGVEAGAGAGGAGAGGGASGAGAGGGGSELDAGAEPEASASSSDEDEGCAVARGAVGSRAPRGSSTGAWLLVALALLLARRTRPV